MDDRQLQLAWLAGLIDGEGCFSLEPTRARLRIVLQERDKFVLERVQEIAGGLLNFRPTPPSARQSQKPQWQWSLNRKADLLALCVEILPYLVLKRERCEEVIEMLRLKVAA